MLLLLSAVTYSQTEEKEEHANELHFVIQRFQDPEHLDLLQGSIWTLTHDYTDYTRMDEVLKSSLTYLEALAKYRAGDAKPLTELGGMQSFKQNLSLWLQDESQATRAYSAVLMGISGDAAFAPQLAAFLDKRDVADDNVYDRGRAAMALGLIGAVDHKQKIAALLTSKHQSDRAGAISALRKFGAKEHAKDIADLLVSKEFQYDDDPSPVYFLAHTETAVNFKTHLVSAMLGKFRPETSTAAMYALVSLDAKEHTKDIAKLLDNEFRKADAAKALALMGAKEYTNQIVLMLKDKSGLVRSAALLSLGVLMATRSSNQVARHLTDETDYVRSDAAVSLLLMKATRHYKASWPHLETLPSQGVILIEASFSPLVEKKTRSITSEFRKEIEKAKVQ